MLSSWSSLQSPLERALDEAMFRPSKGLQRIVERRRYDFATFDQIFSSGADDFELAGGFANDLTPEERVYIGSLTEQLNRSVAAASATLRSFAKPPGRKVMILLSGGWPFVPSDFLLSDTSRILFDRGGPYGNNLYRRLVETANVLGYTIYPVDLPLLTNRYNVNVPIADAAGRFSIAILETDYLVDLELSALEAEGRGEIVSTPRVITANQKEAKIEQGVEIPYQQSASSGATTIQFKKAVLSLTVTPQITPDNNIIMDLKVHKDSVGEVVSTGGLGGTVPSIDTRSIETQVLVADGQTVVLGGIYETERREVIRKVPFLGDFPFVGVLFRSTQRVDNKAELLIFVTPRILEEGSNIY